jgi:hypothetical protein
MIAISGLWLVQLLKHGVRAFLVFERSSTARAGAVPAFGSRRAGEKKDA